MAASAQPDATVRGSWADRLAAVRDSAAATAGAVLGLVPHVLHHVVPMAGAAVFTGLGGNAAFFALGLLLSVPMLRRVHRRFRTWLAPAVAVVVFAALFSLSAFVVGPALVSDPSAPVEGPPASTVPTTTAPHDTHHT